jgi:hypothetical protein
VTWLLEALLSAGAAFGAAWMVGLLSFAAVLSVTPLLVAALVIVPRRSVKR